VEFNCHYYRAFTILDLTEFEYSQHTGNTQKFLLLPEGIRSKIKQQIWRIIFFFGENFSLQNVNAQKNHCYDITHTWNCHITIMHYLSSRIR